MAFKLALMQFIGYLILAGMLGIVGIIFYFMFRGTNASYEKSMKKHEKWVSNNKARQKSEVDTSYRAEKEKLMYKRMAKHEENEARIENEVRDKLKKEKANKYW